MTCRLRASAHHSACEIGSGLGKGPRKPRPGSDGSSRHRGDRASGREIGSGFGNGGDGEGWWRGDGIWRRDYDRPSPIAFVPFGVSSADSRVITPLLTPLLSFVKKSVLLFSVQEMCVIFVVNKVTVRMQICDRSPKQQLDQHEM